VKYSAVYSTDEKRVLVIDMPLNELKKLSGAQQKEHVLVEFNASGVMTPKVIDIWAKKIAEQLNQFENANAAVAKML